MSNSEVIFFGQTNFRNEMRKFGIKTDDRRRHMYLIGKTGMGKSTVLENMIVNDIRNGKGVAVIDPHGDLAEKIIKYIPEERIDDVVYFNPADMDYPIAFNLVEQVEPHLRHLVASGLIGVFKKLWADSWGPRLEYILRNAILAILDYPGSTLLGVVRMLSDKAYRKKVVAKIEDPVVKSFWEKEFAGYADKFASEAVSPIQNKVGQFLSSSFMRNIVGQVKSSVDMRKIMDEGKILIMNMSKGRIGEDNSALLGAMMITKIQLAAMSRVDIDEGDRKDFYLYIDEFQNFSTESFANILSEARKYRLNLIMAHQYIEQLDERVKPAVFGNVGTIVVFRVGAADAEELVKEFTPVFTEEDIVNLPKYEMYLKLMIDGVASDPFSAKGLPPLLEEEKTNNVEKVIISSREKYATERKAVEEKIMRWHMEDEDDIQGNGKNDKENKNENLNNSWREDKNFKNKKSEDKKDTFQAHCSACAKDIELYFKPDGIRPVYCKDCLLKIKNNKEKKTNNPPQVKKTLNYSNKTELKEKKIIKSEPIIKDFSIAEISLEALREVSPVNFKGKEIKNKQQDLSQSVDESSVSEIDLEEGKDVSFDN
ncbi:MAG: type IV secretion system DNA-binding domain-containing protein [Patescibacteria group bacterium]|nr:type IV secretion system DNA-binding domain-containing protein [Patescibacteria group bacterium]